MRKSIDEPTFDATVNVVGSVNLIEASQKIGLDRFVFTSSGGAVYGEGERIDLPAAEDDRRRNRCASTASASTSSRSTSSFTAAFICSTRSSLRLGNVYGPRQNPKGEAGAVAIFAGQLIDGETPTVFGDGTQTRDFVYVADVIDAMLTASRTDVEGAINIGSGVETPLLELISTIGGLGENGKAASNPTFDTARKGDVQRNSIDPSRAAADLGWSPTTSLEDGLRKTVDSI